MHPRQVEIRDNLVEVVRLPGLSGRRSVAVGISVTARNDDLRVGPRAQDCGQSAQEDMISANGLEIARREGHDLVRFREDFAARQCETRRRIRPESLARSTPS